jgi:hypothetical protein
VTMSASDRRRMLSPPWSAQSYTDPSPLNATPACRRSPSTAQRWVCVAGDKYSPGMEQRTTGQWASRGPVSLVPASSPPTRLVGGEAGADARAVDPLYKSLCGGDNREGG